MFQVTAFFPLIGMTLCLYVITRCLSFMTRLNDRQEHWAVIVVSFLTIVLSAVAFIVSMRVIIIGD